MEMQPSRCLGSEPDVRYQKSDKYRCIRSSPDRLGFYAKFQIIFGTVLPATWGGPWTLLSSYLTDLMINELNLCKFNGQRI